MQFSAVAKDYIPAKVNGAPTVFDPRSTIPVPSPSCEVGPDGATIVPLVSSLDDVTQDVSAGGWSCDQAGVGADGQTIGSNFTVGLEVDNVQSTVPAMSAESLTTPTGGANAGSVKTRTIKVAKGVQATIYTWTFDATLPGATTPTTFTAASAEPKPHVIITAAAFPTAPSATAVKNLIVMLRTGATAPGTKRGLTQ